MPATGPAILASNHLSYADWLFLPLVIPRRVTFVAKAEYSAETGIKGWLKRRFFSGAGQVPIDRSGATAAEGALNLLGASSTTGTSSGSTPRAPDPTTAGSIAGERAWRGSPWNQGHP